MRDSWIALNQSERKILINALRKLESVEVTEPIISKLLDTGTYPKITVGVYGGQVQWVMGNPFPIQVCDYDGDKSDLTDRDERGQACRMWYEPTENSERV